MAVYKVPQDVEADDKLIGPFTFRQFVFILIMVGFLYITFLAWRANPLLIFVPLPPAIFFAVLGLWPRKDQPVEIYLQALLRFWLKPRKRLWSQEGHVDHVIVTAPKVEDHQYSDGLSRVEVQGRLKRLAESLDSRGWTSKNVSVQDAAASYNPQPDYSDRLVTPQSVISQPPDQTDIHSSDDVMDMENNPVAQKFDQLSRESAQKTRDQAISQMHAPPQDDGSGSVNYNPYPNMRQSVVSPVGKKKKRDKDDHSGMSSGSDDQAQSGPTISKSGDEEPVQNTSGMTTGPTPAILELSRNSDLNIETLARQAEKSLHDDETIELH